MPANLVLHEGNSFAFYGFHNDCGRHSFGSLCFVKSSTQLCHIISVCNIDHMEIKCLKFLIDRVWRAYVLYLTVDLKAVVVNDHYKVVQFSGTCEHSSFPYLAFLDLAVSKKCVYTIAVIR